MGKYYVLVRHQVFIPGLSPAYEYGYCIGKTRHEAGREVLDGFISRMISLSGSASFEPGWMDEFYARIRKLEFDSEALLDDIRLQDAGLDVLESSFQAGPAEYRVSVVCAGAWESFSLEVLETVEGLVYDHYCIDISSEFDDECLGPDYLELKATPLYKSFRTLSRAAPYHRRKGEVLNLLQAVSDQIRKEVACPEMETLQESPVLIPRVRDDVENAFCEDF